MCPRLPVGTTKGKAIIMPVVTSLKTFTYRPLLSVRSGFNARAKFLRRREVNQRMRFTRINYLHGVHLVQVG